jgi:hypothetical protein
MARLVEHGLRDTMEARDPAAQTKMRAMCC